MLAFEHLGDDMGVRDGSHTGKAIVLSLASVDLRTVFLDGSFSAFEFGTALNQVRQYPPQVKKAYRSTHV